jgi:hypothetical protein
MPPQPTGPVRETGPARALRRPRLTALVVAGAVLLGGLTACDLSPAEPDPPVLVTGTFVPVDPERTLSGSVAAVTQFGNTDISVGVQGMEPEETLAWHLREGTCAGSGDIFGSPGAYPPLVADDEGSAEGGVGFSLRLRPGRSYSAEIVSEVGVTGPGAIACADMAQE